MRTILTTLLASIKSFKRHAYYRCKATEALGDDVRFKKHGLVTKFAPEFAFLLHGFHCLKDEGVMSIIQGSSVRLRVGKATGHAVARPPVSHCLRYLTEEYLSSL